MPGPKPVDLTNRVFGRLTVVELVGTTGNGAKWRCVCNCGREKVLAAIRLTCSKRPTRSCGHHVLETRHRTHGRTKSPEYAIWRAMVSRCTNPKYRSYSRYGARGISVCDRWKNSFENFMADMGKRPSADLTLERRDNNGPYAPENCIWATRKTQQRNKRNTRFAIRDGLKQTLAAWREQLGLTKNQLKTPGQLRRNRLTAC